MLKNTTTLLQVGWKMGHVVCKPSSVWNALSWRLLWCRFPIPQRFIRLMGLLSVRENSDYVFQHLRKILSQSGNENYNKWWVFWSSRRIKYLGKTIYIAQVVKIHPWAISSLDISKKFNTNKFLHSSIAFQSNVNVFFCSEEASDRHLMKRYAINRRLFCWCVVLVSSSGFCKT